MNNAKVMRWLNERGIKLEESFADALKKLAMKYKTERNCGTLDEVYRLLGASKQNIYYWTVNPCSIQTKKSSEPML